MESRIAALRSQDVYSGLQTVDQTSGLIAAELETTRVTGMAATVAANIKGIDIIQDPKVLTLIASQEWGIDSLALPSVLQVLEEVGYITIHRDSRGKAQSIDEHIPIVHDDVYDRLGEHWLSNTPTELDQAAVGALERLSTAPVPLTELHEEIRDARTLEHLLEIGEAAQFARRLPMPGGDSLVWSPYCAYEQPESLSDLFAAHPKEQVREQFAKVKAYQGLPLDGSAGVLSEAIGHGILLANTVTGTGGKASFAFVPYRATAAQRRTQKVILDKAIILLACVRYGQHRATHPILYPEAILGKLKDGGTLRATTEAGSQYLTAARNQILQLERTKGGYAMAKLIDTPDNIEAVALAIDLLQHGEPIAAREDPAQRLLFTGGQYLTPLMTMKDRAPTTALSGDVVLSMLDTWRGERNG